MTKIAIYIHIFILLSATAAFCQQDVKSYNWIAPAPEIQLDMEAKDDIKGLGRLFLPAMTNPDFEPVYIVSKGDSILKVEKMGKSVWLRPGRYTVTYGSGTLDQMIREQIELKAEETRILRPTWCGLTIRIIDETREWLKEPYEIYRMPEGEAYGIGYGAAEQLGEKLQTWILRPGLYKIIKLGEHINTYVNFSTIRLLPGELTQYTLVVDSETQQFIGAGILEFATEARKIKNWNVFSALYGSFTLNRANDITSENQQTSMAFVAQVEYNVRYNSTKHYFLSRGLMEEGWNMQRRQSTFRSYLDNIRLKNIYIYNIYSGLGLYGRLFLETNFFQTTYYYDDPKTIYKYDEQGNLVREHRDVKRFRAAPNFSPLELKEGFGINLSLIRSLRATFNVRAGMGFRQNINWNLYTEDPNMKDHFYEKLSSYLRGPEASLVGNYRILRNIMITSELDMLISSEDDNQFVYDWENNVNIRLSKNISIDYTIRIKKDQSIVSHVQSEQILLLRYSYILF